jgi:hypothetical protein
MPGSYFYTPIIYFKLISLFYLLVGLLLNKFCSFEFVFKSNRRLQQPQSYWGTNRLPMTAVTTKYDA